MNEIVLEREQTTQEFLDGISENGKRVIFQVHSEPEYVFRSFSLNGQKPHIHTILDYLAGQIGRDLKYVFDYEGNRYRISFADYIK